MSWSSGLVGMLLAIGANTVFITDKIYSWSSAELEELQRASLLLAADVIYSDELTDAFFNVLGSIMPNNPNKVLYLALEKRYNFTIDDIDAVANGYSHFLSDINDEEEEDDLETKPSRAGL